jgi:hypothetical protein
LKVQSTTVGDMKVTVQKHPVMRGLVLKARLLKLVAPALSQASALSNVTSLAQADVGALAPALQALAAQIQPTELPGLISEVLACTTVIVRDSAGMLNQIDLGLGDEMLQQVFSSRSDLDLFRVVAFALKVNFADFFVAGAPGSAPVTQTPST